MTPAVHNVRRLWLILWTLTIGLVLMLLFATLRDRPFDPDALRQFPTEVLLRGRQFSREARIAGTAQAVLSLITMAMLCFHPTASRWVAWFERLGRGRWWLSVLTVSTGVTLTLAVVEFPFAFYLGYMHEKAYGLTSLSVGGWLRDHLLGLGVSWVLTALLWVPLYAMIRRWPRRWWIPAGIMNLCLSACLVVIYPVLLMPLFNRLVPVRDPQVMAMAQRLAAKAGVRVDTVQEMIVSEKSSRVNAMVTGLGPTKQVIFYDTLLKQFPTDEVEVVMAHELAHALHNDVTTGWLLSGATEMFTLCCLAWVLRGMVGVGPLDLDGPSAPKGLAAVLLFSALMGQVTGPVHNFVSRRMEVRADQFALTVTGKPAAFVSGFKRLAAGNPGDVDPPDIVEILTHSHPSMTSRVRAASHFKP